LAADELPKELLLQCEGKMNAVLDARKPETRSSAFRISLRLKDGSIVDTQTGSSRALIACRKTAKSNARRQDFIRSQLGHKAVSAPL